MLEEKLIQNNDYNIVWNKVDQYFICHRHDIKSYNAYLVSVSYDNFIKILDENYLQLQDELLNGLDPIDLWNKSKIIYEPNFQRKVIPDRNGIKLSNKKVNFLELNRLLSKSDMSILNKFILNNSIQDTWFDLLDFSDTKYTIHNHNMILDNNHQFINENDLDNANICKLSYSEFLKIYPDLMIHEKLPGKTAKANWNMMKKRINDRSNNVFGFNKKEQEKDVKEVNDNSSIENPTEEFESNNKEITKDTSNETIENNEENNMIQQDIHHEEKEEENMENTEEYTINLTKEAYEDIEQIRNEGKEKFGVELTDSQVLDYLLFKSNNHE